MTNKDVALPVSFALRLYNSYKPGWPMWPSPALSWPLVLLQLLQNSGSLMMFMLRVKTLSLALSEVHCH